MLGKEQHENIQEVDVGSASAYQDEEMKEVQVGKEDDAVILVVKTGGKFYSCGSRCSHLGGPLAKGVLFGEFVSCPWHRSSFSIVTGVPDQGPTLNGIPVYPIREENGRLLVKIPKELQMRIPMAMSKHSLTDTRKFVIIGSGPAAISAAETLRASGYQGEIKMVSKDHYTPFDRTVLSKDTFKADFETIELRDEKFFQDNDIALLKDKKVDGINVQQKTIHLEGGENISYDKLLIASGSKPKSLDIPGKDLKNVFLLRSWDDMLKIREACNEAKNVVLLGTSFISHEIAAAIKKEFEDKVNVTLVGKTSTLFEKSFGTKIGKVLQKIHENKGVKFVFDNSIESIHGEEKVNKVTLKEGGDLEADVVILGVGVQPNTEFCKGVLDLDEEDGGIITDEYLKTSQDDIYAAGDVAKYQYWYLNKKIRIEHYSEAFQQGVVAAWNMLDKKIVHDRIPFFWTKFYDFRLTYIGNGADFDDVYIDGQIEDVDKDNLKFVAYYLKENKVIAVASIGVEGATMIIDAAMRFQVMPKGEDLKSKSVSLDNIKANAAKKRDCWTCRRKEVLGDGLELF